MNEITPSELPSHAAWRAGNILDVRDAASFAGGHPAPAVSLPVASLVTGALEAALPGIFLPPRHEPLVVVAGDAETGRRVAGFLADRGRDDVGVCILDARSVRGLPTGAAARGASRRHLWRPPPFLEEHRGLLPPPERGPVLDLAAGSCRAAVWLAERGHELTAVDRDPEALELGARLADSRGVSLDLRPGDLRRPEALPAGPWAAVLVFRYLERDLLRRLGSVLLPGGVVLMRTFRRVADGSRQPARRHLLEEGELLRLFPAAEYDVLVHVEDRDPDGRPASGIAAGRRPDGRACG